MIEFTYTKKRFTIYILLVDAIMYLNLVIKKLNILLLRNCTKYFFLNASMNAKFYFFKKNFSGLKFFEHMILSFFPYRICHSATHKKNADCGAQKFSLILDNKKSLIYNKFNFFLIIKVTIFCFVWIK